MLRLSAWCASRDSYFGKNKVFAAGFAPEYVSMEYSYGAMVLCFWFLELK